MPSAARLTKKEQSALEAVRNAGVRAGLSQREAYASHGKTTMLSLVAKGHVRQRGSSYIPEPY